MSGGAAINATLAELVSSGAGVLAVCADASRRAALASGAAGLARFNGGAGLVACHRCGGDRVASLNVRSEGGLALTDYAGLAAAPDLAAAFEHVVLVDPPASEAEEGMVGAGEGYLHQLWTEAELPFALAALEERTAARKAIARVFRSLREAGEASGPQLREALAGEGPHPLAPESAARSFCVLAELGLLAGEPNGGAGVVGVVSSEGTDLERSAAFRAYSEEFAEAKRFLERPKLP